MRSFVICALTTLSVAALALNGPARSQTSDDAATQLSDMPERQLSIVLPTNPDNPNPIRDALKASVANAQPGSMQPPDGVAQMSGDATPRASFASAAQPADTFPGAPQEPKAESGFFVDLGSPPAFFVELSKDADRSGEPSSIRASLAPSTAGSAKFVPEGISR